MNKGFFRLGISVCAVGLLFQTTACHSSKKAARKKGKKTDSAVVKTVTDTMKTDIAAGNVDNELAKTFNDVWAKGIQFKTFSGKAKCHYEGKGQNQDFTAHVRIKNNEAAWVMITALGGIVQVARLMVTPDSFQLINYLEKSYTSMKTSEANKVLPFPVNFSMLQNLLIGNALLNTGNVVNTSETNDAVSINVKKDNLIQNAIIRKADKQLQTVALTLANDNSSANIALEDYQNKQDKKFPADRKVNVVNQGENYFLEMDYSEANFDGNVDMPFSVPKNYSKK